MDIEQRVERLERENRRLKLAGGAVVAVLLTVALVGAVMPQATEMQELNVRGQIYAERIMTRMVRIIDDGSLETRVPRIQLDPDGIYLRDASGNNKAMLATVDTGATTTGILAFLDSNGNITWRAPQ